MTIDDLLNKVLESTSPLISAEQLVDLLSNPRVKVFDVRGTWASPPRALPEEYHAEHIDGAAFLDWVTTFNEPNIPIGQASIIDEVGATIAFERLGINADDLVVVYDDYSHMPAGRIWISMRHWGFKNVRVLNGGLGYWKSQGYPTSQEVPQLAKGNFKPALIEGLKIDIDEFLERQLHSRVIDGRGPVGYAGNADDPRSGHIPESINVPFSVLLDPDTGLFLDAERLSNALVERAPDWKEASIITSCGAGYSATVVSIALEILGKPATLFDGSFAIWRSDPNRAVDQSY
ncbi:MAG: rhodanese-like domain-containing protein [Lentilitoribacter sp.]